MHPEFIVLAMRISTVERRPGRRERGMNEDVRIDDLRSLALMLRAMLEENQGAELKPAKHPDRRSIAQLFGIIYAEELHGLEDYEFKFLASQAGLPAGTYFRLVKDGRDLAKYVGVCRNSVRPGATTQTTVVIAVLEREAGR